MATALKTRASGVLALMAGVASILLSYLLMGHFVMAALIFSGRLGPPAPAGWRSSVHYYTHSGYTLWLIGWVVLAAALGALGLWWAPGDSAHRRRASLAGVAARFAIGGLIGAGVDVFLVAALILAGHFWLM